MGMAIANALGSNVQNVFLALGIPWAMKTVVMWANDEKTPKFVEGKETPPMPSPGALYVAAGGIKEGVLFMALTLFMLIAFVLFGKCSLSRVWGGILIMVYFIWLFIAILQSMGTIPHFI